MRGPSAYAVWLRRCMLPHFPALVIKIMAKTEPRERVSMALVVNKLEEIAQDASDASAA